MNQIPKFHSCKPFGKDNLFYTLGNANFGLFSRTQYRFFRGLDKLQNFGGGHPLSLNLGKFTNADWHLGKFSLCS